MKQNELLMEHFLKMMGMPKKIISQTSKDFLDSAIKEITIAKEMNQFSEEF